MIGNIFKRKYHAIRENSPSHKAKLEKQKVGTIVKCGKCGVTNKTLLRNEGNLIDTIDCEYICIDCKRRNK